MGEEHLPGFRADLADNQRTLFDRMRDDWGEDNSMFFGRSPGSSWRFPRANFQREPSSTAADDDFGSLRSRLSMPRRFNSGGGGSSCADWPTDVTSSSEVGGARRERIIPIQVETEAGRTGGQQTPQDGGVSSCLPTRDSRASSCPPNSPPPPASDETDMPCSSGGEKQQQQQQQQQQSCEDDARQGAGAALCVIDEVRRAVEPLARQVGEFCGDRRQRDYAFLDEMLTRQLLVLDTVQAPPAAQHQVRVARRVVIQLIERTLAELERRASQQQQQEQTEQQPTTQEHQASPQQERCESEAQQPTSPGDDDQTPGGGDQTPAAVSCEEVAEPSGQHGDVGAVQSDDLVSSAIPLPFPSSDAAQQPQQQPLQSSSSSSTQDSSSCPGDPKHHSSSSSDAHQSARDSHEP